MTTETEIWNRVIEHLKPALSESELKTWFSQTSLLPLRSNLAVINVPNKFVANWLTDNYIQYISRSLKDILTETPEIKFKVNKVNKIQLLNNKTKNIINNLNKYITFDTFIIGDANRFAFSSAIEISNHPGDHYNRLRHDVAGQKSHEKRSV